MDFLKFCGLEVLFVLISLSIFEGFRYDGFSSIDIKIQHEEHISALKKFSEFFKDDEINFQFIRPPYRINSTVSIIVSPVVRRKLQAYLDERLISYSVVIKNYQKLIDKEHKANMRALFRRYYRSGSVLDHIVYLRYSEIEKWILKKVKQVSFARFVKFGSTFEKRQLYMVQISKNDSLPIVWLDGGIHAREWIAVSSTIYVIDMLLKDTKEASDLLSKYQYYIVPVVNPDGYEYSHKTHRLWRKNRAKYHFSKCTGVDMNRNFPYEWGGESSSTNPCDDQYRGPTAASEPEIQSIIEQWKKIKNSLKLVVSIHAYGQYILQPFSYSLDHYPDNYLEMTSVAIRTAFDLQLKHDEIYLVGRPPDILYPASGSSDDYAVGVLKIPFSFTIELPDQGRHGFTLPPRFIKSVGNQLWEIMMTFSNEIQKTNFYKILEKPFTI